MATAIWSGKLSFGLIDIPVKLNSAVKEKNIQFNQLNSKTGNRVSQKRVDAVSGVEVPYDDIVKGYELTPGNYITITPDELDALDPDKSSTIEIDNFVNPDQLDPVMFDHPYYLVPDESNEQYALLREALRKTGKTAIGRFVMRGKQYVTCVWPHGDALAMTTMHYADEVLTPAVDTSAVTVKDNYLDMAVSIIDSMSTDNFDPATYKDEHREEVVRLIQDKADGVVSVAPVVTKKIAPMSDLLASLEATMKAAKAKKDSNPIVQKVTL